jgi:hypothetical protein
MSLASLSRRARFTNILPANEVMARDVKVHYQPSSFGGFGFIDRDHFNEV